MTKENALTVALPEAVTGAADVRALVTDWHTALDLLVRAGDMAETTRLTYQRGMGKFLAWAETRQQISDDAILEWKAALMADGRKPGAVNTWLAGVRAFFTWATNARRLAYNPAASVKGAKRKGTSQKHKRDSLTDEEVRRVLAVPDRQTQQGKRDYAILCLMTYAAARTVEVHRADLDDLRTEKARLVLDVKGKGRTEADEIIVIANPDGASALYDWLAARGEEPGPLFTSLSRRSAGERLSLPSIRAMVKDTFKAAGVRGKNKTTHSLRHTAITNAVRHGAQIQKVQSMARHANISTTMIYYHETDRVENPAEEFISYNSAK